jgi:hypothetical protein
MIVDCSCPPPGVNYKNDASSFTVECNPMDSTWYLGGTSFSLGIGECTLCKNTIPVIDNSFYVIQSYDDAYMNVVVNFFCNTNFVYSLDTTATSFTITCNGIQGWSSHGSCVAIQPSPSSSNTPTNSPTGTPTNSPTKTPSNTQTRTPTNSPTGTPSNTPTRTPTNSPSNTPTRTPTGTPTNSPTGTPSNTPTRTPTNSPTGTPTNSPSNTPTNSPSGTPSNTPTRTPTNSPSNTPTNSPTKTPTNSPSKTPSPTRQPTIYYGYLDPLYTTAIPYQFSNANFANCLNDLTLNLRQCFQYELRNVAIEWLECANSKCELAYSSEPISLDACHQSLTPTFEMITQLHREAEIIQNWACYGWISKPFRWDAKVILKGGYKSANFLSCQYRLENDYQICKETKRILDESYVDCAKEECNRNEEIQGFGTFLSDCYNEVSKNYEILSHEEMNIAFQKAQEFGCALCNFDTMCDSTESFSSCPSDCPDPCNYNSMCDSGEDSSNCPSDCPYNPCNNNGYCDPGEDSNNCSSDCPYNPCNNNGSCESYNGEDSNNCPYDCQTTNSYCGNGSCEPHYSEDSSTCPTDCHCGNGICETSYSEDSNNCPNDCQTTTYNYCGNGICEMFEDSTTCPGDCRCGNGSCESAYGEDSTSCPSDCTAPPVCNNNYVCEYGEDNSNCATDCPETVNNYCGNNQCEPMYGEDSTTCPSDCTSYNPCNYNYICDSGEDYTNCPSDCQNNPCNYNGFCETYNGEDSNNCSNDCRNEGQDYGELTWTSQWNSALTVQQGWGTRINWIDSYMKFDECLSSCGNTLEMCGQMWFNEVKGTCDSQYSYPQSEYCLNDVTHITTNILMKDNGNFAFYNAQSASGCSTRIRQLESKQHGRLRNKA